MNGYPWGQQHSDQTTTERACTLDQLLGDEFAQRTNRRRFVEITSSPQLTEIGRIAVSIPGGLDPLVWLGESRKAAIENVYAPEILDSLSIVTRGIAEKPETLELSEPYLKNAGRAAQVRAAEAAHRLAAVWRKCINSENQQAIYCSLRFRIVDLMPLDFFVRRGEILVHDAHTLR